MTGLRVALFVEGSSVPSPKHKQRPLEAIWNGCLGEALGLQRFEPIVPISKKHLVAMDPRNPPMSGAGEALDVLMTRMLGRQPFDVAVVAWDLVPAWNPRASYCRWEETLNLYRFLADSKALPDLWKEQAARRYEALSRRPVPGSRGRPPAFQTGMVLPVCMEPMFESLLVQDEAAVKRALGIQGRSVSGWPGQGWGDPQERRPDEHILAPAIRAVSRLRPKLQVYRMVGGDLRTKKDEWGELLLRRMLNDSRARPNLLEHPIVKRLAELVSRGPA
jgi:hypothetical protein